MSRFMQKKSVFFIEKVDFSFKSYVPDEFQVYKNDKNIEILNDSARSPPPQNTWNSIVFPSNLMSRVENDENRRFKKRIWREKVSFRKFVYAKVVTFFYRFSPFRGGFLSVFEMEESINLCNVPHRIYENLVPSKYTIRISSVVRLSIYRIPPHLSIILGG